MNWHDNVTLIFNIQIHSLFLYLFVKLINDLEVILNYR